MNSKEVYGLLKNKEYNLLITDYQMPDVNGLELLHIVREDKKGEEILLYFLERGDTCASSFASAISNGKCGIRAIAEKESEIIFLPKEKLYFYLNLKG